MNQLFSICFCFRQLVVATPSPTSLKIQKTRERVKAARNRQLFLDEDSDEDIVEKETLRGVASMPLTSSWMWIFFANISEVLIPFCN